jgi:AcrR family transcriptional regulator
LDKQQEILNAALKLFVEYGFHGTPTSKIAHAAGVANGTLFHYFKTKDDLIIALYLEIKSRMGQCVEGWLSNGDSLKSALRNFFLSNLQWALNNQLEFKFIQQFSSSPFQSLVPVDQSSEQMVQFFSMIQSGIKEEILKPVKPELIFILGSSNLYGVFQYLTTTDLCEEIKNEVISQTFEMFWDMIT